jgi:hypothetical protein
MSAPLSSCYERMNVRCVRNIRGQLGEMDKCVRPNQPTNDTNANQISFHGQEYCIIVELGSKLEISSFTNHNLLLQRYFVLNYIPGLYSNFLKLLLIKIHKVWGPISTVISP